jgi:hypothetical protein
MEADVNEAVILGEHKMRQLRLLGEMSLHEQQIYLSGIAEGMLQNADANLAILDTYKKERAAHPEIYGKLEEILTSKTSVDGDGHLHNI